MSETTKKETKRFYPHNPLGIIALFVFFIETINATTIYFLKDNSILLMIVVIFIVAFPTLIALTFFVFLWKKPEAFYTPSDYKDDRTFLQAIFKELKFEQQVLQATLNPPSNPNNVFTLVDDLIAKKEYLNVIRIGRGYLKLKEFAKSLQFFEYVKTKTDVKENFYTTIIANCGYSLVGLNECEKAIKYFEEIRMILKDRVEVWHLVPLAYCYYKTQRHSEFEVTIKKANNNSKMFEEIDEFKLRYPEIANLLKVSKNDIETE